MRSGSLGYGGFSLLHVVGAVDLVMLSRDST